MKTRIRTIKRIHDPAVQSRGSIRCVGLNAVVWVDHIRITEVLDKRWTEVERKVVHVQRREAKVGSKVLGFLVEQIDPVWIEEEKEILKRGKVWVSDEPLQESSVASGTDVIDALIQAGFVLSKNEARRKLTENAVRIDGQVITEGLIIGNTLTLGKKKRIKIA